ncbi:disulfide bond formation protein B [Pontibaca methylaminivorans]|uniref:disulfide bond formation protein B n=1 Tax=Pontibaca methylaminivorans TaxID=515897 RepID=UPI002FD9EA84
MTRNLLILLAGLGSAALLLGALAFQYLGGMAPCSLCIWQRWPHGIAILIAALALIRPGRILPVLGALAALATAGIGLYHTGVERGWWEGPATCTASSADGMSSAELMAHIMAAPLVRCDDVAWEMFGLSMASWNAVASLVLVALWLVAAARRPARA